MRTVRIEGVETASVDPDVQLLMAAAYAERRRPVCLCSGEPGIPMYIARSGERYVLKRMPNSGLEHHPDCRSFEPPTELSGRGALLGTAIQDHEDTGITALRLGFSMTAAGSRAAASEGRERPDSVRADPVKLTLRGLLHYLWEEAGLHQWTPERGSQRSWHTVRRYLLDAARNKQAKSTSLSTLLFIPEPFAVEREQEIVARRKQELASLLGDTPPGRARRMILVGEIKGVAEGRSGHKLIIKHLPDLPFQLPDDLHRRMQKQFARELSLWGGDETTHLVAIATFDLSPSGKPRVHEMSLALLSSTWLPLDHVDDHEVIGKLTRAGRRFTKSLRYSLSPSHPLACAVLTDTAPRPVALYVLPASASPDYLSALRELVASSDLAPWLWKSGEQAVPPLPDALGYVSPDVVGELDAAKNVTAQTAAGVIDAPRVASA